MGVGVRNSSRYLPVSSQALHLQTSDWEGKKNQNRVYICNLTTESDSKVVFSSLCFEIGSKRSLRQISVHLLPGLRSAELGSAWLPRGCGGHKNSSQPRADGFPKPPSCHVGLWLPPCKRLSCSLPRRGVLAEKRIQGVSLP